MSLNHTFANTGTKTIESKTWVYSKVFDIVEKEENGINWTTWKAYDPFSFSGYKCHRIPTDKVVSVK